jgi:hypothetical protein
MRRRERELKYWILPACRHLQRHGQRLGGQR